MQCCNNMEKTLRNYEGNFKYCLDRVFNSVYFLFFPPIFLLIFPGASSYVCCFVTLFFFFMNINYLVFEESVTKVLLAKKIWWYKLMGNLILMSGSNKINSVANKHKSYLSKQKASSKFIKLLVYLLNYILV